MYEFSLYAFGLTGHVRVIHKNSNECLTRVGCTIIHVMLIFQIRFLGLKHPHRNFETKV